MKRLHIAIAAIACLVLMPMYVLAGSITRGDPKKIKSGIKDGSQIQEDANYRWPLYLIEATWVTGLGQTSIDDSTGEVMILTGEIAFIEFAEVTEGDITLGYSAELINQYGRDVLQGISDDTNEVSATRTASGHSRTPVNDSGDRIRLAGDQCYWKITGAGADNTGLIKLGLSPIN